MVSVRRFEKRVRGRIPLWTELHSGVAVLDGAYDGQGTEIAFVDPNPENTAFRPTTGSICSSRDSS